MVVKACKGAVAGLITSKTSNTESSVRATQKPSMSRIRIYRSRLWTLQNKINRGWNQECGKRTILVLKDPQGLIYHYSTLGWFFSGNRNFLVCLCACLPLLEINLLWRETISYLFLYRQHLGQYLALSGLDEYMWLFRNGIVGDNSSFINSYSSYHIIN